MSDGTWNGCLKVDYNLDPERSRPVPYIASDTRKAFSLVWAPSKTPLLRSHLSETFFVLTGPSWASAMFHRWKQLHFPGARVEMILFLEKVTVLGGLSQPFHIHSRTAAERVGSELRRIRRLATGPVPF